MNYKIYILFQTKDNLMTAEKYMVFTYVRLYKVVFIYPTTDSTSSLKKKRNGIFFALYFSTTNCNVLLHFILNFKEHLPSFFGPRVRKPNAT